MAIAAVIADMSEQPMPEYVSHERVRALEIKVVGEPDVHGNRMVTFCEPGYGAREIPAFIFEPAGSDVPGVGDFFFLTEGGSISFMQAASFHETYSRAT